MQLYNLTIQGITAVNCAVHGSFSGMSKQQEVCVARGSTLQLLYCDPKTGRISVLCNHELFGVIRSLLAFRLTGGSKDYIAVGSDSGRVVILEYLPQRRQFDRVHQETYGKTGCRRVVPGQYLAMDPKGRADRQIGLFRLLIGAVERQKLVYILNRDAKANLTISSPLEAHKNYSICFAITGIDVGFEDCDHDPTGEATKRVQQTLTFYELDLGLNHVVRKYAEPLAERGNHLIAVPGGNDGPSGVIVCCENCLIYKNLGDQPDIKVPIPRRRNELDESDRPLMIICSAAHKTKSMYFFLLQSEQGDVFKVMLEADGDIVTEMRIKRFQYFDTLPPANAMCILKTGFLFLASEFGNHHLYQIAQLGDDEEPEYSSRLPLEEGETFFYEARELRNLAHIDQLDSLCPVVMSHIAELNNEDAPQVYVLSGRGPRSALRILRNGLEVSEMAVSELPGNPTSVWTVKRNVDDAYHAHIVVSFINATLVLSIGETVEEVTDSGFLGTTPTLGCGLIGEDSLLQIYPSGIRHIRADRRVNEWRAPPKRHISKCAINRRQVVISLTGGEIVYFELDSSNQLREYSERRDMNSEVLCMSMSEVPEGELRSRFLTVGLADRTVRIISLDTQDCLAPLSMQALPSESESLMVLETSGEEAGTPSTIHLHVGLQNGLVVSFIRRQAEQAVSPAFTGDLSDNRTRYLGTKPVKLFRVRVQNKDAGRFHLTPLSYNALEYASSFSSEQCPEGIVAIAENSLRILALEKLGGVFNQVEHPLKYTPRRLAVHHQSLIIIETDHAAFTEDAKEKRRKELAKEIVELAKDSDEKQLADEMAEAIVNYKPDEAIFGSPRAQNGKWASRIRMISARTGKSACPDYELLEGEAAFCVEIVHFRSQSDSSFVLVGCGVDLELRPAKSHGGCIYTFLLTSANQFVFVHRTPTDDVVNAIHGFNGMALVGIGNKLRMYDFGKKKLLAKCENKQIPIKIVDIKSMGQRIVVSDCQESVHFMRYKRLENQLVVFADDTTPRYVVSVCILDYDTVVVGDRFGNISVLRLPKDVIEEVQEDPTGVRAVWDRGNLNGASQKIEQVCHFYVGDIVTSMQRTSLVPGSDDSLIYTTISGKIGMLVPFLSRDEFEFFQTLEMHMRVEFPPLCGRDHLSYRSFYAPVRGIVDGDLCEQYVQLESAKQRQVATSLDQASSSLVVKRLEDLRARYAF